MVRHDADGDHGRRYAEVNSLLKDHRLGELGGQALLGLGISDGPLWDWWNLMLLSKDGEDTSVSDD